ncbi:MAG: radical SAM protein [Candidatus Omnitrophica bacterium]|nr:radical SAM protein [Candidatus Omnitrophota bacterium]
MKIRQVQCKSILNKSGLANYCLNCYIGCEHGCRYCYARFMQRYSNHQEPWGDFVDVKINAVDALTKEVKKKRRGRVFVSSVCDGWQPLEAKYKLTRRCLEILMKNGFSVSILTKSALIERDLDLLTLNRDKVELGFTLTMFDEKLKGLFEPLASSPGKRISILKKAADLGIETYAFLGPLLPYLSDKEGDIDTLFSSLIRLKLGYIYLDRLNPRFGVWTSISSLLKRYYPHLITQYKEVLFNEKTSRLYSASLANRARKIAKKYGLEGKLRLCF